MKRYLLFSFLLLGSWIFGQEKLHGKFYYSTGFVGESIQFHKNNRFNYSAWGCTGGAKGEGKYQLTNDELVLFFDTINQQEIFIEKAEETIEDSILIKIQVLDENKQTLPFVNIEIQGVNIGSSTDFEGIAYLKVPKSIQQDSLKITYIGYFPFSFPLKLNQNYEIKVIMKDDVLTQNINGAIYRYKFHRKNKKSFTLRRIVKGEKNEENVFIKRPISK